MSDEATPLTIAPSGDLDFESAQAFRQRLDDAIAAAPGAVLEVDLSGVPFMDSVGLSALAYAHKKAAANGGAVVVTNVSAKVEKLLATTGMDRVLRPPG